MNKPVFEILFDIGGTYLRAYLIKQGKLVKTIKLKQPSSLVSFKKVFVKLFDKLSAGRLVSLVDIGVAGRVSGSLVISCSNIPFLKNFDFKTLLPAGVKLIVDNDARWQLRRILKTRSNLSKIKVLLITLGTGVGRALAIGGLVKKIKKLESRELWEREYKLRRYDKSADFVKWLQPRLFKLIKKYRPTVLVLSGGVVEKKKGLKTELCKLENIKGVRVLVVD
ncbi:MAG: ROK family protein [Patescibacteria group bacterium]